MLVLTDHFLTRTMPQSDLLEALKALEMALHQPDVRHDSSQVAALLHDNFMEFGCSGAIYHKPDIMTLLAEEAPVRLYSQDYALKLLADGLALLTYRSAQWAAAGEQLERHSLRSSIWRRTAGQWQMVFHQGTPTEPFAPTTGA